MTAVARRPRSPVLRWARTNLFRSPADGVVTVVAGAISLYLLYRVANFVFVTGRWEIVRSNLSLFMVGSYDRDEVWRPAVALIVVSGVAGLAAGAIRRRQLAADAVETFDAGGRARELVGRFWPALLGVVPLLLLARTATPWLVAAGAILAAVALRAVGLRAPTRALLALGIVGVGALLFSLWLMLQAVGWDTWGGLMLNVFLAGISITLCFPLGVVLALGRRSKLPLIRLVATGYIELFRGVPLIALLLMANSALGFFVPADLAPGKVVTAIVVFTLFTSAYVAEIVRGGLQSIPVGQIEAGQAQGMSPFHITMLIVLPQALRNVIPALVGQSITLFKDTTLAGEAMGFLDLLSGAQAATQQPGFTGQNLIAESLVFVAFLFWVGSFTMSRESKRLEEKLGVGTR